MGVGLGILVTCYLNDIAIDRGWILAPRLIPYGFAAFLFSMAVSLANRFVAFSGKQRAGDHWLGVYDGGQGQGMTEIISVSGAESPDHGRARRED